MNKVIDEIKTDRIEKFGKLFFYGAIATAILAVFKICLNPEILTGAGKFSDYVITLLPIYMYYNFRKKTSKHKGQFIKWTENYVEFKSKDNQSTVQYQDIQTVNIGLDNIAINLKDNSTHTINIEDYTNYDDRLRIKKNFETIITAPNNT